MERKQPKNLISGKYVEERNFWLILRVKCILSEINQHFGIQQQHLKNCENANGLKKQTSKCRAVKSHVVL